MAASSPNSQVPNFGNRTPVQAPAATDKLGAVSGGLGDIAQVLGRQRAIQQNEEERVEQIRLQNEAEMYMEAARAEAKKAQRSVDIEPIYKEHTSKLGEFVSALPDADKPLMMAQIARRAMAHALDLDSFRGELEHKEVLQVQTDRVKVLGTAVYNGTLEDLAVSMDELDAFFAQQAAQETLDDATIASESQKARTYLEETYVAGLFARGAYGAAAEALSGDVLANIEPGRRSQLADTARTGQSERALTDIQLALDGGADPAALRQQVLGMRANRTLTEPHTRQALGWLASEQTARAGAANLDAAAAAFEQSGGVLDLSLPANERKAVVDHAYQRFTERNPGMSRADGMVAFARAYNRLPEGELGVLAGMIQSQNPEAALDGIEQMTRLDVATAGRIGDSLPDFAKGAFTMTREVERKMYGAPLPSGQGLPQPVMSAEQAVAEIREARAQGLDTDIAERRAGFETALAAQPERIVQALSQNRAGLGGKVAWVLGTAGLNNSVFALDATQVPPHLSQMVARVAADELAKSGRSVDQVDEASLGAAIDTAAATLAREVGLRVSTFNDNSARPEFLRPGTLTVMAPEATLDPVIDPDVTTHAKTLGMGPYRATVAMSLVQDAARNLAGAHPDVAAAFESALATAAAGSDNLARSIQRGELAGPVDELLLVDPKPIDLLVWQIRRSKKEANVSDPSRPFSFAYSVAFDELNAALGLPRGMRWDPVIEPTPDTLTTWQRNQQVPHAERKPVHWAIYAQDRNTGNRVPLFDRSSQVLGRRQKTISFDDERDNPNPLTRGVSTRNQKTLERLRMLELEQLDLTSGLVPQPGAAQ